MIVYREDKNAIEAFGGIMAMKRFPVLNWIHIRRGDFEGHIPGSWQVPKEELNRLGVKPINKAQAMRKRPPKHTQADARKVDAMACKLGLLPNSNIAKRVVEGTLDEEEAFALAYKVINRHQNTRYDELLFQGYSYEEARSMCQDDT